MSRSRPNRASVEPRELSTFKLDSTQLELGSYTPPPKKDKDGKPLPSKTYRFPKIKDVRRSLVMAIEAAKAAVSLETGRTIPREERRFTVFRGTELKPPYDEKSSPTYTFSVSINQEEDLQSFVAFERKAIQVWKDNLPSLKTLQAAKTAFERSQLSTSSLTLEEKKEIADDLAASQEQYDAEIAAIDRSWNPAYKPVFVRTTVKRQEEGDERPPELLEEVTDSTGRKYTGDAVLRFHNRVQRLATGYKKRTIVWDSLVAPENRCMISKFIFSVKFDTEQEDEVWRNTRRLAYGYLQVMDPERPGQTKWIVNTDEDPLEEACSPMDIKRDDLVYISWRRGSYYDIDGGLLGTRLIPVHVLITTPRFPDESDSDETQSVKSDPRSAFAWSGGSSKAVPASKRFEVVSSMTSGDAKRLADEKAQAAKDEEGSGEETAEDLEARLAEENAAMWSSVDLPSVSAISTLGGGGGGGGGGDPAYSFSAGTKRSRDEYMEGADEYGHDDKRARVEPQ